MKDPTGLIFLAVFTVVQVRSTAAEMGEKSTHGLILVSLPWKFQQVSVCHPEILLSPHL